MCGTSVICNSNYISFTVSPSLYHYVVSNIHWAYISLHKVTDVFVVQYDII